VKIKLPDSIISRQDLASTIIELRDYSKWLSHESIKKQLGSKKAGDKPEISSTVAEIIRNTEADSTKKITDIIDALQSIQTTARSIKFTLAAPAPLSLKAVLVKWCRANISPDILVSFDFNSNILGGVVVRYGSRIFDWSFRRQILADKVKFSEVLNNV